MTQENASTYLSCGYLADTLQAGQREKSWK